MTDFLDKGKDLASDHPAQADEGMDKAEQFLDDKTGGAHGDQLASGEKMVEGRLGVEDQDAGQQSGQ